jgi:hypothetical protein
MLGDLLPKNPQYPRAWRKHGKNTMLGDWLTPEHGEIPGK